MFALSGGKPHDFDLDATKTHETDLGFSEDAPEVGTMSRIGRVRVLFCRTGVWLGRLTRGKAMSVIEKDAEIVFPESKVAEWRAGVQKRREELFRRNWKNRRSVPALRSRQEEKNFEFVLEWYEEFDEVVARERERAAFMECAEAALRSINNYKQSLGEANVLLVLSDVEKTVKRGSEQSEELPGAISRSFVLDAGYTPRIVFIIELIL